MDFLFRCEKDLEVLNAKYLSLLSVPYHKRDFAKIKIVQDMIADIEFAVAEYRLGADFRTTDKHCWYYFQR